MIGERGRGLAGGGECGGLPLSLLSVTRLPMPRPASPRLSTGRVWGPPKPLTPPPYHAPSPSFSVLSNPTSQHSPLISTGGQASPGRYDRHGRPQASRSGPGSSPQPGVPSSRRPASLGPGGVGISCGADPCPSHCAPRGPSARAPEPLAPAHSAYPPRGRAVPLTLRTAGCRPCRSHCALHTVPPSAWSICTGWLGAVGVLGGLGWASGFYYRGYSPR